MRGNTGRYEKRLSDLAGLYQDGEAHAALVSTLGDPVVYDVEEFKPGTRSGDLIYGVTRMSPGRVGDEYFMTRGHIHACADRPEIYYGQRGEGLMLLKSPARRDARPRDWTAQVICYVPPFWIHRSVNVGTGRSGDGFRLSRRQRPGLRDHRRLERHASPRVRQIGWRLGVAEKTSATFPVRRRSSPIS